MNTPMPNAVSMSSDPGIFRLYSLLTSGLAILNDSMQPVNPSATPAFFEVLIHIQNTIGETKIAIASFKV